MKHPGLVHTSLQNGMSKSSYRLRSNIGGHTYDSIRPVLHKVESLVIISAEHTEALLTPQQYLQNLLSPGRRLLYRYYIVQCGKPQSCLSGHVRTCPARHIIQYHRFVRSLCNSLEILVHALLRRFVVIWNDHKKSIRTMSREEFHVRYGSVKRICADSGNNGTAA